MMEKKETAAVAGYETIEHWYGVYGTSLAIYAGTVCHKGWKPGKQVTEKEYLTAVSEFSKASMSGTGGRK